MKIILIDNVKSNIDNSQVRWYLSSQEIWIGKEENYNEIEETIGNSYGSFKWLFSTADTILFDKENLKFKAGIIKVNEPINVTQNKLEVIKSREGTMKLIEGINFNCELSDYTTYYLNEDTLVSCSITVKFDEQISVLNITKDFSFIVKDNELVGFILKDASKHIIKDDINFIDSEIQSTDFVKTVLVKYLNLIEKLNEELTSDDEEKLENDFRILYDYIKTSTLQPIIAIKENILSILDFM